MNDQLRAARALRTTIRATRQETEESRRLAPQVVEGLIAAGLCRLAVPASLGGHEAEPGVALQIYEVLAGADASVAWIAWNNQLVGLASRYSSDAVRTEVFSDARRLFANSTRPSGRAVVVEGGFRVSGRWALVSGCELADWIPVMCVVTEGTEPRMLPAGEPEMRMAYLPQGSYRILDTWHVGGLRGTGSHDIVVDEVFVPAERTFSFTEPAQDDRPLSRMPFFATVCADCAAHRRQPRPCSSWQRQRSRSIRFQRCGIVRGSKPWSLRQRRSWLQPDCYSTRPWATRGPHALKGHR
jgi:alkylation response protein AidB-like acyl-CoA dehydrogenase